MTKKDCQITFLDKEGNILVHHPETNADQVVDGENNRVPSKKEIKNWSNISSEVAFARKNESSLGDKIDKIDKGLEPQSLLNSIKKVDEDTSGLNANFVQGRVVDDERSSTKTLWTSSKVKKELDSKIPLTEVTFEKEPNKIPALNEKGKLIVDTEGTSASSLKWTSPVEINLKGDVTGVLSLQGDKEKENIDVKVINFDHSHNGLSKSQNALAIGDNDIVEFKKEGVTLSRIDEFGRFSGSANSVAGFTVNDKEDSNVLWSSDKILSELDLVKKAFNEIAKIDSETKEIRFGGFVFRYGTVELPTETTIINIEIDNPLEEIFFVNHSLQTPDANLNCVQAEKTSGTSKLTYLLNKPAVGGNLNWFMIGR